MSSPMNDKQIDKKYEYNTKISLGEGTYGKVHKGIDITNNNKEIAIKVIPVNKIVGNDAAFELLQREVAVMSQISGTHVIELIDVKRTPNNFYIILEYCNGGDLNTLVKQKRPFPEEDALKIVKQIALAFITIESSTILNEEKEKVTIMHRDIKPANILFHNGLVKIADFGFAKMVLMNQKDQVMLQTYLGTPLYMSPQILDNKEYSVKCDIWSTGVMLYQMLFANLPWIGSCPENLLKNIQEKKLVIPDTVSKNTQDLLKRMLTYQDMDRISWKEVFEHSAMTNIEIPREKKKFSTNEEKQEEVSSNNNQYGNEYKKNITQDEKK